MAGFMDALHVYLYLVACVPVARYLYSEYIIYDDMTETNSSPNPPGKRGVPGFGLPCIREYGYLYVNATSTSKYSSMTYLKCMHALNSERRSVAVEALCLDPWVDERDDALSSEGPSYGSHTYSAVLRVLQYRC